jgi:uncharacterized membrane protein
MLRTFKHHLLVTTGALSAGVLFLFVIWPLLFGPAQLPPMTEAGFGSQTLRARIVEIIESGEITLGDVTQTYEVMRIELLEGEYPGLIMEIDYGKRQVRAPGLTFAPGDEIYISLGQLPDGLLVAYYTEYVRSRPLLALSGLFIVAILFISRWKGLRSLIAMTFSLVVIVRFIIPYILGGTDPVLVSIVGSAVLLATTLYITYGWTLKTHASVLGTVLVLLITGGLAWGFLGFTHLTGQGSEDALFLLQMPGVQINLRGLLLGGMLIGALGVLDDLVTTQSAVVFELHAANPNLGAGVLFQRAMRIGQDHVAATVNTLVLAYAGASLPMLLLFTLGRGSYFKLINFEFVTEEIVRTLVGSLGLIAAVPLTTFIAAVLALRADHLHRFWGPATGNDETAHIH